MCCINLKNIEPHRNLCILISFGMVLILLYVSVATSVVNINTPRTINNINTCHRMLDLLNGSVYSEGSKRIRVIPDEELHQIKRFGWSSAIVVPKYKLIFFPVEKVACTQWKKLLQLIQNITSSKDVHNPAVNQLKYLNYYNDVSIRRYLLDSSWTKATVVREPRTRILSAYLQFVGTSYPYYKKHISDRKPSFAEFLHYITLHTNSHWSSQIRLPLWLYRHVMIGKLENVQEFAIKLLKRIGAWEEWGSKWGPAKNETIFSYIYKKDRRSKASEKLRLYYTQNLEDMVFNLYSREFELFNYSCAYISNA